MSDKKNKVLSVDELVEKACEYEAEGNTKAANRCIKVALKREDEGKK